MWIHTSATCIESLIGLLSFLFLLLNIITTADWEGVSFRARFDFLKTIWMLMTSLLSSFLLWNHLFQFYVVYYNLYLSIQNQNVASCIVCFTYANILEFPFSLAVQILFSADRIPLAANCLDYDFMYDIRCTMILSTSNSLWCDWFEKRSLFSVLIKNCKSDTLFSFRFMFSKICIIISKMKARSQFCNY